MLLSAYIAFSRRQYFRMINLSFAVQNGSEWVGGGPLKLVVYWEESGVSTVGDSDLALALPGPPVDPATLIAFHYPAVFYLSALKVYNTYFENA